jgi:hypothetical protein
MLPMDHTRAIVHSRGTFLMCPPASYVEGLSDSEDVQSHDGIGSATAVLSLDKSLLAVAGTEIIMPSRRPIAKRLGARGLDGRRHVARIRLPRERKQLAPAVVSPCIYIIQDGAVEPENIASDVTTSFSRSRAAIAQSPSAST